MGGHVTLSSGAEFHAAIRPHAGRSRPHLSLREGSEQPPTSWFFQGVDAAGQTFDEAVAAYDRGDYATAVRGFLVHAEQGDATAQFNLGLMYDKGEGVLKDEAEAVRWYRLAAGEQSKDTRPCT